MPILTRDYNFKDMLNITDLIFNESAVFYKFKDGKSNFSRYEITTIIRQALGGNTTNYLKEYKVEKTFDDKNICYSTRVFKYRTIPSFVDKDCDVEILEERYGFILIVEYNGYVILTKKGAKSSEDFVDKVEKIDYSTLQNCFINANTAFHKFTMHNIDGSDSAIRSKRLEAINLQEGLSILGLNKYVLSSLRFSDTQDVYSLGLNTSRVNNFGTKVDIDTYLKWCIKIIDIITLYSGESTYLSVFAEVAKYTEEYNHLKPSSILFDFGELIALIESGSIVRTYYKDRKGNEIEIPLVRHLKSLQLSLGISNSDDTYKIQNGVDNKLCVSMNKTGIKIDGGYTKDIYIVWANDNKEQRLLHYINTNECYNLYFEEIEFVYRFRKLFKDSKLLHSVNEFLKVFVPCPELERCRTEKGNITTESTSFDNDSVFGFVEEKFMNEFDEFICDDLGKEWADHIGINESENRIAFYVEKADKNRMGESISASAFQEVVSQAQKNLGNLTPTENQLDNNTLIWNDLYRLNGNISQIVRMRKGTRDNAVSHWKSAERHPNIRLETNIVVNFISLNSLRLCFDDILNGRNNRYKNQAIQILWLISSLDSAAKEARAAIHIYCRP